MTSECFVYITLPRQTAPVTAGRFELSQDRNGVSVGRFVYGRSYRQRDDALPIDPAELKLAPGAYQTTQLKGVFGALRDAGPDYWGRLVIERYHKKPSLDEMTYLLNAPDDCAGALGFGLNQKPPAPTRKFNRTRDLAKLQAIADAVINDTPLEEEDRYAEQLLLVGTAMGGARPKCVVEDTDGLWLAKFNRDDDTWNAARVEHSMLVLARACGLTTAESRITQIGGKDVLLVKRFDREKTEQGYLRARMISGLTLLRTDETARENWSYVSMAEELRRVCAAPKQAAPELFRRMVFNALISNTDDHPRNHAIIAKDRDWKLSPAYDLTPTNPVGIEHRDLAMICGDAGRFANAKNLLSQCARFLLERAQAQKIVDDMAELVTSRWYEIARGEGVSEADCKRIAGAFVYPGFRAAPAE